MRMKETDWIERLERERPLQVKTLEKAFSDIPKGATMLIVTPRMVDEVLRAVPRGRSIDVREIRGMLAQAYQVDHACPVTTGIALRVVAEAACSRMAAGTEVSAITPFWRAVDPDGKLAGKLSCGRAFVEEMRRAESG